MDEWEDNSSNYDPFNFLPSFHELFDNDVQVTEDLLPPSTAKRKLFGDSQTQDGDACRTSQNQPKLQPEIHAIHINDDHLQNQVLQPSRKDVNILPNDTEYDGCSLKGKSGLDSVSPILTRTERKRLNDQNSRKRKRDKEKDLHEKFNDLTESVQRVSQENAQLLKNMEQKLILTAMFKLNFHDRESKREVVNVVVDLPDIDYFLLTWEKGILKLKGRFDAEAVLHKLNRVCPTHLLSTRYAITEPSMPGPSTTAMSPPPVHFR